jgi:hypothetical protein
MIAIRKNVEFRKTERNPDLSGNHNGGDKLKMLSSVRSTLRQAQGERIYKKPFVVK